MFTRCKFFGFMSVLVMLSIGLAACEAPPGAPTLQPTQAPAPSQARAPTQAAAATQTPQPTAHAPKGHHIALVQFSKDLPGQRIMQLGFHDGCVAMKYDCELLLTDSPSASDVIPLAEKALAEPVDGIVFYAGDKSLFPTIAKFKAQGIPIVTPHFMSFDQKESGLTAVVGTNAAAYGAAAADAIGDKLAGKGTAAVSESSFNQTENLAAKSFGDEMASKYPNIKVLPAQAEGSDQAGAVVKAEAIIAANPDISAAFSTAGTGPTTWSTAAASAKKNLVIIGMDYIRPNLDLVKAGKVYGLVAQPLYDEFYQAAVLAGAAIDGKPVLYRNLLPAPIIFLNDLDKYYTINARAEAGIAGVTPLQTPVPAATAKP